MDREPAALESPASVDPRVDEAWREDRGRMLGLARRMLGDATEAEDVVQEAFGRLARVDLDELEDVKGWLAVVVRRLCLDRIRSARLPTRVGDARLVARGRHLAPAGAGRRPRRPHHTRRPGAARTRGRARPAFARGTHRIRLARHLRLSLRSRRRDRRTVDGRVPSAREPGAPCHPGGFGQETRRHPPGRHRERAAPRRVGTIHRGLRGWRHQRRSWRSSIRTWSARRRSSASGRCSRRSGGRSSRNGSSACSVPAPTARSSP